MARVLLRIEFQAAKMMFLSTPNGGYLSSVDFWTCHETHFLAPKTTFINSPEADYLCAMGLGSCH
jgi:hypothetical protein